jgi:transposase
MCLTAGQVSDHIGAKILYPVLPDGAGATMIADKGYDSDEYRAALEQFPMKWKQFCWSRLRRMREGRRVS